MSAPTITVRSGNAVEMELGETTVLAGLVPFDPDPAAHGRMDVINTLGQRIPPVPGLFPKTGTMIWAVSVNDNGSFWAYELHLVQAWLKANYQGGGQ